MRNSPRSGLIVAAAAVALTGVGCDSIKQHKRVTYTDSYGSDIDVCMDEYGNIIPDDECPPSETPELKTLRAQTAAQAEQIGVLRMQLEATEATCGDTKEVEEGGWKDDGLSYSGSIGFDQLQ